MTSVFPTLAAGASLGFTVASPIGPMGLLCIQRTIRHGFGPGLATGLGAATIHASFGFATITGFGTVARFWLETEKPLFCTVAAAVFLWCSIRAFGRSVCLAQSAESGTNGVLGSYSSALALGVANPMTFLLFAAASPTMILAVDGGLASAEAMGVFLGSAGWWLGLTSVAASLRGRLSESALGLCNRMTALSLGLISIGLIARGVGW